MPMVPETPAMRRVRALVATAVRTGNTEDESRWRKEYMRLESVELRRRADELDRKQRTD